MSIYYRMAVAVVMSITFCSTHAGEKEWVATFEKLLKEKGAALQTLHNVEERLNRKPDHAVVFVTACVGGYTGWCSRLSLGLLSGDGCSFLLGSVGALASFYITLHICRAIDTYNYPQLASRITALKEEIAAVEQGKEQGWYIYQRMMHYPVGDGWCRRQQITYATQDAR